LRFLNHLREYIAENGIEQLLLSVQFDCRTFFTPFTALKRDCNNYCCAPDPVVFSAFASLATNSSVPNATRTGPFFRHVVTSLGDSAAEASRSNADFLASTRLAPYITADGDADENATRTTCQISIGGVWCLQGRKLKKVDGRGEGCLKSRAEARPDIRACPLPVSRWRVQWHVFDFFLGGGSKKCFDWVPNYTRIFELTDYN